MMNTQAFAVILILSYFGIGLSNGIFNVEYTDSDAALEQQEIFATDIAITQSLVNDQEYTTKIRNEQDVGEVRYGSAYQHSKSIFDIFKETMLPFPQGIIHTNDPIESFVYYSLGWLRTIMITFGLIELFMISWNRKTM